MFDFLKTFSKKNKTGFKEDEIFLLSIKEYEKYKNIIPNCNVWWWLRDSGTEPKNAAVVYDDGNVFHYGLPATYKDGYVRPVIKIDTKKIPIGTEIKKYGKEWVSIDTGLAIAKYPIERRRFNGVNSGKYITSEIRFHLLDTLYFLQKFRSK